jgi:enoyl-CoA hydratase/carnithine racemase
MPVRSEREGPVATVILDWPEQRNALDPANGDELQAVLRGAAADAAVCGVVLTGEGAFCAGGNLKGAQERAAMTPDERRAMITASFQGIVRTLLDLPVPTIAAIDGPAVGMGFDIALACDSRLIGDGGWCRQGWGRLGLLSSTGGILSLRRLAPGVLWQLLDGQPKLDGPTMERLGLGEAVSEGTARARAQQRVAALSEIGRAGLEGYVELDRAERREEMSSHLEAVLDTQTRLLYRPGFNDRAAGALGS